jgi:DNA-binding LacI/PurR family transcriptional regulator
VLAGVSTATVSRALAGHSSVNAQTRARIQALAQEHDVRPNQLARNLRLKSTGAIGLVLPLGHARTQHLTDPFFLTLLGLLADLLVERGYDILVTTGSTGWSTAAASTACSSSASPTRGR